MPQTVKCDLLLYADDTCLTFQHENVEETEDQLNLNFCSFCDWFIDNKLSIHLVDDKTKFILSGTKLSIKRAEPLNIVYGNVKIKQYTKVTYLGCILDESYYYYYYYYYHFMILSLSWVLIVLNNMEIAVK